MRHATKYASWTRRTGVRQLARAATGTAAIAITVFAPLAQAVTLVADDRRVVFFSDAGGNEQRPSPPFSNFNVSGQSTVVTSDEFSGSGNGFGESDFGFSIQESFFDVTFEVDASTVIDLTGSFAGNAGNFGLATLRARLFAGDQVDTANIVLSDVLSADTFDDQFSKFDLTDTLTPGLYRLVLQTDITPGGFGTYGDFSFTAVFSADPSADSDEDGVPDASDNCTETANAAQTDADADGYGNLCDADLNNDCVVNTTDLGLLRVAFFSSDAAADFNSDGIVNVTDLGLMRTAFFAAPGPSGQTAVCDAD